MATSFVSSAAAGRVWRWSAPRARCRCGERVGTARRRRARACLTADGVGGRPSDEPLFVPPPPTPAPVAAAARTFQYVGWADVERMCRHLAARLRGRQFDAVLAVTRGGMVPATMLAQALELRYVLTATVIFYTDSGDQFFGMTEPRFLFFPPATELVGRRLLVVDDVWDSGRTAIAVRRRAERAEPESITLAVLHYKPQLSLYKDAAPDFYADSTNKWVVYPWERISPNHTDDPAAVADLEAAE